MLMTRTITYFANTILLIAISEAWMHAELRRNMPGTPAPWVQCSTPTPVNANGAARGPLRSRCCRSAQSLPQSLEVPEAVVLHAVVGRKEVQGESPNLQHQHRQQHDRVSRHADAKAPHQCGLR